MVQISPSVLAADLSKLAQEVDSIEKAGADMVHLDVMDGAFVTNISFGLPVIASLRKHSSMIFDVHLMINEPEKYIERFITESGADIVTFHLEATKCPLECIKIIKKHCKKAAVSIKPATPIEEVYPYLQLCDMILIMTVEPGYGGQALIPETLFKVNELRKKADLLGIDIDIQVDGGINAKNSSEAIKAGANILVAGSAVFGKEDRREAIDSLRMV